MNPAGTSNQNPEYSHGCTENNVVFSGWGIINLDTLFQVNVTLLNLQQQLDLFQRFKNKL